LAETLAAMAPAVVAQLILIKLGRAVALEGRASSVSGSTLDSNNTGRNICPPQHNNIEPNL
jgi:hypothetical protein